MKASVVALLLLYSIASWKSISCNDSQKTGIDVAEIEIYSQIQSNPHFFSRRLLETKNTNGQLERQKNGMVEEKGKEIKSETEEESSEMESNLILPEETDDSESETMEGQKKPRETEKQVEHLEQQDIKPMNKNKELTEEKKDPEKIKLKSGLREGELDMEAIKKEGRDETIVVESSKVEAEKRLDSELAVEQNVLDEEAEARGNVNQVENKAAVKLQKESENERKKPGIKKKKGTKGMNVQGSSVERLKESGQVNEDTRENKIRKETDSLSHFEGKVVESELSGSEDGTRSDVAIKVNKRGKTVLDMLAESEKDITEVKLQKTLEKKGKKEFDSLSESEGNIPDVKLQKTSESSAHLNLKTIKEKKPHKERTPRKMSKMEAPVVDDESKSKVLNLDHTISDVPAKAKKEEKKVLDSTKSELAVGSQGIVKKSEKKLENAADEILDAEQNEKDTQRELIGPKGKASHSKTKDTTSGKEVEGEENSEVELEILTEGNELKDTDSVDETSDVVAEVKKETEQALDSESELESLEVESWDEKVKQEPEDRAEASLDVEAHKNAGKDVANHEKAKLEELKEMEQEDTSDLDEETPKKIKEKKPQKKIIGDDRQVGKEEKALKDINGGSKNGQQSAIMEGINRTTALDSDDDDVDDEDGDFMQDFADLPSKFQDTAQRLAGHLRPNIVKITDTSKEYFNKANQQITDSFSPLVGKQYAPFLSSLISYGLLLLPLAVVIILFEHIRALLSLQTVLLFVNVYLAAYFATLLLATFIIGSEPMTFFYKNSQSGYLHLQLLQALGYIAYIGLLTFDVFGSCSSEALSVKVMSVLQWFVAVVVGLHYYVTVFHRAMGMKGPHTSWKSYGMYSIAFCILSLFARIKRIKKGYSQVGDVNTDKKN